MAYLPKVEFSSLDRLEVEVNGRFEELKNYYVGKIKTIIDAAIVDKEQKKSIKDLVQMAIWDTENWSNLGWHFRAFAKANNLKYLPENHRMVAVSPDVADEINPYLEK